MKRFLAELHVHTLLSPCAEVEMIPPLIVSEAIDRAIDVIAITDHNASANVEAVQKAAKNSDLTVLPGMEVQTQEEVHVLCLFDRLDQLAAWQARVDAEITPLPNDPEFFGEQFVVDETGEFIRREHRLLLTSTCFSIEQVFQEVCALGGMAIPAHVDRRAFGLIANLGIVPSDLHIEALEISRHLKPEQAGQVLPQIQGYPLIQSGDVHRLEEFLGLNEFYLERPSIDEIRKAFHKQAGRSHMILPQPVR